VAHSRVIALQRDERRLARVIRIYLSSIKPSRWRIRFALIRAWRILFPRSERDGRGGCDLPRCDSDIASDIACWRTVTCVIFLLKFLWKQIRSLSRSSGLIACQRWRRRDNRGLTSLVRGSSADAISIHARPEIARRTEKEKERERERER